MQLSRPPLLALLALGVLGVVMSAQAQLATDMKLEDAGFVMRRADTPDKVARLRLIPPRQFVTRTGKSGRYYLWADPDTCKCVFVDDGRALQSYAGINVPDGDVLDYHVE